MDLHGLIGLDRGWFGLNLRLCCLSSDVPFVHHTCISVLFDGFKKLAKYRTT